MSGARFVVLGVARARSTWFRAVAQWATNAALPVDFVKCVSVQEVHAHLATGRRFSAVLLDGGVRGADRDLVSAARDAGCVVVVVDGGQTATQWSALGVATVLTPSFSREQLLDVLVTHAGALERSDAVTPPAAQRADAARGQVIAVCGAGGTGASTAAIALAQELARTGGGSVLLADLALRADQAMLHDARDVVPGVQELVEAHRGRRPTADEVRSLTFDVADRGYRLLLGLRRSRYWSTVRPAAFLAAFDTLRTSFSTVVCDVTADVEGEDLGGSLDVEERNLMARTAVAQAAATVVVGTPGTKGIHALGRVIGELVEAGVDPRRIVPVVNLAPRSPRARAEITAALAALTDTASGVAHPTYLPRRAVEAAVRDNAPIPPPLGRLLAGAAAATRTSAHAARPLFAQQPERVVPGSLGSWSPEP